MILILALAILNTINGSKISNKNILLPLADIEVEYEITAEGGCFDWSASNTAISVTGHDIQGCLKSIAKVRAITKIPSQSFIYVKEKNSESTVFIVEVMVQEISKLSIITKQKQLDLDTQEELHVQGYDNKGNTFTTLEGLKFEWRVGTLEMVKFAESGLKVSEKRARLEFNSDIIVVKGKQEGLVKVFTRVIELKYQSQIIETDVDLVVIQKFQFSPDYPVYYLPTHSKIQFNLLRADGKTKIQLPSQAHVWTTTSKQSTISQNGLLTTHQIENDLRLKVVNSEHNKIEAIYHVVDPKYIDIDIWEDGKEKRDGKVTHLIVGRLYRFQAFLKDQNNQRIFSTNEYSYSSNDITLLQQTVISLTERSNVKLEFSWDTLKSSVLIHFVKQIQIITVFKTYIHLPIHEHYKLIVQGGSGQYRYQQKFYSPNIFEMKNDVMVALQTGENTLYVYDNLNVYNDLEVTVYVTDVSQILPYEVRKELLVNQPDDTYYQAIGDPKIGNYTQCRAVSFSSDIHDTFTTTKQQPIDDNYLVCNGLILKSSLPGQYSLSISTQRVTYSQTVRVYGDMHFEKPFYLITPHSTITTKVLGGPLPWDSVPFNEDLSEGILKIDMEKYHFNCYKQQANFTITRVNRKSDLLPKPKAVTSTLPVRCLYPDAFKVYNEQNQEINWLFREEKVLITVVAVNKNLPFYNSSSLLLDYATRGLIYQNRYLSFDIPSGITNCKFIVSSNSHNNHKDQFSLVKTELDFVIHHTLKLIPNGEVHVYVDQSVLFLIESSTSQIECRYDGNKVGCQQDQVTITPKNTGQYQLVVYDLQLNYSVSATLIVVEPSQLNLELSQQITVIGKPVNATSTFYFYKKMMHVTSWQSLKLVDNFGFTDIKQVNNHFIINPNREGLFKLQTIYNSLTSNSVDLKVIPKLTVETVYMPTECETHIVFPSYPQFGYQADSITEVEASVSSNIVTIKSKRVIGNFQILVYLKQQSTVIDAVAIPVIVDMPNLINLKYGRKVELGSTVRVVAEFLIQNHEMNLCLCPVHKILWYQDDKLVQSGSNQLGLSISTVVLGKINVKIEAYKQQAYTAVDVERLNAYTRNLFINTQAQYHIPLLIPPNSKLSLGQDVKSVDELALQHPNIIESRSITLQPQLLMAQTPMLIQVQNIYQLYPMNSFINLKVDEKITIDIAYLNEQGYQFEDVENNLLEVVGHTRHVVSIKINVNQLEIQGLDQGYALIKLNCGQQKHDYILIKVGATLLGKKAYLGSVITYAIDGVEKPQWYSNCGDFAKNQLTITRELNDCYVEANDQGNKFKAGLEVITPSHIIVESNRVDNYLHIKLNVNPKIPQQDSVDPNFTIKVEIDQDDWFQIEKGSTPYEYYIKPIISSNDAPMPKKVKVNAYMTNSQVQLEGSKEILFEREFQLPQKEIVIQNSSPIQVLQTPYYRNVEKTHQDSHLYGLISTQYSNGKVEITFDFSQCQEPTEGNVYFENKQVIKVKFVKEGSHENIIFLAAIVFFGLVVMNYYRQQ